MNKQVGISRLLQSSLSLMDKYGCQRGEQVQAHGSAYDLIFHSRILNPRRSLITPETAERITTRVML